MAPVPVFTYSVPTKLIHLYFWAFHRNSGDTGEIELKTAVEQIAAYKSDRAIIVSLGSFTDAATKIAGKNDIELISGASLQATWNEFSLKEMIRFAWPDFYFLQVENTN